MKIDAEDKDFLSGMKDAFDMSKEEVEKLLMEIDSETLIDLHDAILTDDIKRAREIVDEFGIDEDEIQKTKTVSLAKKTDDTSDLFQVGDSVLVGKDKVKGTVEKPTLPHGLIGVKIKGKLKVFDKSDVKLSEGVIGMAPMFSLTRMQELAGIPSLPVANEVPNTVEVTSVTENVSYRDKVMASLDDIACNLPNITVADLKEIRTRAFEIFSIMNESIQAPRNLKK